MKIKQLVLILFIITACSEDDPIRGCAQLKADAQQAFKAHRDFNGSDAEKQRLYNIYKQLSDEHFAKRCP